MYENKTTAQVCALLGSDESRGLSEEEAKRRCEQDGPNELVEAKKRSALEAFLEQLCDPLIYVLLAASAVSLLLHETSDAVIILSVVALNAFVGVLQEGKAQRALDSLKKLTQPKALVIRNGTETEIASTGLVVGDLICLESGCQVPADVRLILADNLFLEEAALTGEAEAVEKNAKPADTREEAPLGDRKNMAFMSTVVTKGHGRGIVTATGMDTQIGRIAAMMNESREGMTPLQRRLGELGKLLGILSVGICVLLFAIAVLQKRDIFEMLLTAISLAVAAVPEGLAAVVTLCLALSVTRMVKINTIIRRLPSVETLGAVSVVCSDKTGTLTQNRMTAVSCFFDQRLWEADALDAEAAGRFLEGMTLCNDAVLGEQRIGDPTELAMLELSSFYHMKKEELERRLPRTGGLAFDSERKMMSTFHKREHRTFTCTKGAPDRVLEKCSGLFLYGKTVPMTQALRNQIENAVTEMSSGALRTLAVAFLENGTKEEGLTFLGLVGMKDPVRPEAAGAVQTFHKAGVTTVMITGDHIQTALAVGRQLGIADSRKECLTGAELAALDEDEFEKRLDGVRIFARVSPADKVRIVKGFQAKGKIVAMTGDGVNDAPSLKTADVGIAMGKNGTDVARQASDMILTDDNFATIEKAIEEGRGVYENIRKSVLFLLSSNLGEILTMFVAVLFGLASPLKSSHILWINLITDSLPALALGVDKNDGEALMEQPPRRQEESLFANGGYAVTAFYGALIALISLTAFFTVPYQQIVSQYGTFSWGKVPLLLERESVLSAAQTYAFTVLGMCQLFHAVGMRDVKKSIFRMDHLENGMMIFACLAGLALQFAVTEVPFLVNAFGTAQLSGREWLYLAGLAAFPLLAHELFVLFSKKEVL